MNWGKEVCRLTLSLLQKTYNSIFLNDYSHLVYQQCSALGKKILTLTRVNQSYVSHRQIKSSDIHILWVKMVLLQFFVQIGEVSEVGSNDTVSV